MKYFVCTWLRMYLSLVCVGVFHFVLHPIVVSNAFLICLVLVVVDSLKLKHCVVQPLP